MTQYLISVIHQNDNGDYAIDAGPEEVERMFAAVGAFNEDLQASGSWVFAGGLEPPSTATVVDATGSDTLVTDGPFAETKEVLGGFWVVEAPDLDAALDLARRGSAACGQAVEVRPFQSE
ncbi:MAG: hypothetical protein JOZ82_10470 [Marmoricola sp.]|nr:hypothetical protein [Marmoricola sp.]